MHTCPTGRWGMWVWLQSSFSTVAQYLPHLLAPSKSGPRCCLVVHPMWRNKEKKHMDIRRTASFSYSDIFDCTMTCPGPPVLHCRKSFLCRTSSLQRSLAEISRHRKVKTDAMQTQFPWSWSKNYLMSWWKLGTLFRETIWKVSNSAVSSVIMNYHACRN